MCLKSTSLFTCRMVFASLSPPRQNVFAHRESSVEAFQVCRTSQKRALHSGFP